MLKGVTGWLVEGQTHTLTLSGTTYILNTRRSSQPQGKENETISYLNPSALGMNRLGFGGSLWQRGTFTGRGLFLGAEKKNTKAFLVQSSTKGSLVVSVS